MMTSSEGLMMTLSDGPMMTSLCGVFLYDDIIIGPLMESSLVPDNVIVEPADDVVAKLSEDVIVRSSDDISEFSIRKRDPKTPRSKNFFVQTSWMDNLENIQKTLFPDRKLSVDVIRVSNDDIIRGSNDYVIRWSNDDVFVDVMEKYWGLPI